MKKLIAILLSIVSILSICSLPAYAASGEQHADAAPKNSRETVITIWAELEDHYYGIRNDNGSLWNQYRCHWDYDAFGIVAGTWDLEVGRPVIDYSEMFGVLCNP